MGAFGSGQGLLGEQASPDTALELVWAVEAIAHSLWADIEGQSDHELAVQRIAATLNYVARLKFKSSWVVNLLEVASEVPCVVVLPLDQA